MPKQIDEFFFEVLIKPPRAYFTIIEFNPIDNPKELIEKHQAWNLSQMRNAQLQREKAGHTNWAKRYHELQGWYKRANYQRVVKIECLQNLYCFTLQQALFYSQILFKLDGQDDSNFNFKFKIDRDFIDKIRLRNFWDIYLYKFWEIFTRDNHTILLSQDHELIAALNRYFKVDGNSLVLQEPFHDNTGFVDSKDHFEIRLADILGNILHRYWNKGQCMEIGDMICKIASLEKNVPLYTRASFKKEPPR